MIYALNLFHLNRKYLTGIFQKKNFTKYIIMYFVLIT